MSDDSRRGLDASLRKLRDEREAQQGALDGERWRSEQYARLVREQRSLRPEDIEASVGRTLGAVDTALKRLKSKLDSMECRMMPAPLLWEGDQA